jgi:hypothetical protein
MDRIVQRTWILRITLDPKNLQMEKSELILIGHFLYACIEIGIHL